MAVSQDLINFDVIETQKENIQSLPSGRSARKLAGVLSPTLPGKTASPSPLDTKNLNESVRKEFESELASIGEADDPLDIYDRYVKWTFDAYPSAQATPQSQLLPLLERATKHFLTSSHYKNDPRYLKLWLLYIKFFSDSPRETFAFLSRHNVGEGLALFYEEFAAWLENAERWIQADEVYKMGLQREARPTERLMRKYNEFQSRYEQRPQTGEEPSSPALPSVRPALAAKMDPFAASQQPGSEGQAGQQQNQPQAASKSKAGRQKLAVFADDSAPAPVVSSSDQAKGWESIGTTAHRKKENVMEARPWVGETLKAGKKTTQGPKMAVFKDEFQIHSSNKHPPARDQKVQASVVQGKRAERTFVNLTALYRELGNQREEFCIEETRARHRGWLDVDWSKERKGSFTKSRSETRGEPSKEEDNTQHESHSHSAHRYESPNRTRKIKTVAVKSETQTVKTNLNSPAKSKPKRKSTAEPTMTFHTKAATAEIYDIFNGPLKSEIEEDQEDEGSETGPETDDDDYTSTGDSTATGRFSTYSDGVEEQHDETSDAKSASEWSDFTARKHIPGLEEEDHTQRSAIEGEVEESRQTLESTQGVDGEADEEVCTPTSEKFESQSRYVPMPPDGYEPPSQPFRSPTTYGQNRLPFMTPIVEKTESSIATATGHKGNDYFNSKTPCKGKAMVETPDIPDVDEEELFSPFKEIVNEAIPDRSIAKPALVKPELQKPELLFDGAESQGPIIQEMLCNPMDEDVKRTILENLKPSLESFKGYFGRRDQTRAQASEIRKYIKATSKSSSRDRGEKTHSQQPEPLVIKLEGSSAHYAVKRELGRGAYAPVYLAAMIDPAQSEHAQQALLGSSLRASVSRQELRAVKMEDPPTPWEFFMMREAEERLRASRAFDSIVHAHEMHIFADECYLIEEYREQGTLLDLVNLARSEGGSCAGPAISSGGLLDETLAMFFTVELFRTVEALHAQGLLHGDLKADNCLLRLDAGNLIEGPEEWTARYKPDGSDGWAAKGLALIDFGRGVDVRRFKPGVGFVTDFQAAPTDCPEMREMRPWTYQVDYYGLAGVVHTLLFGKYIETTLDRRGQHGGEDGGAAVAGGGGSGGGLARTYRITEKLKRYWQTELWGQVFDLLLNPVASETEESRTLPVLEPMRQVREQMEAHLQATSERAGLRSMLKRVERR